jgi:hypothetical protein
MPSFVGSALVSLGFGLCRPTLLLTAFAVELSTLALAVPGREAGWLARSFRQVDDLGEVNDFWGGPFARAVQCSCECFFGSLGVSLPLFAGVVVDVVKLTPRGSRTSLGIRAGHRP